MARCKTCTSIIRRGDTVHEDGDGFVHDACLTGAASADPETWDRDDGEEDDKAATEAEAAKEG